MPSSTVTAAANEAAEWQTRGELRWRLREPFGAEIDADLSFPLSDKAGKMLAQLLRDHGLLIAHGQSLDRSQHEAVMQLFGPIIAHRKGDSLTMRSEGGDGPGTSKLSWHADTAYSETPFEAISLHALDVVPGASSTQFINVERALETLPAHLRDQLDGRDADMMSSGFEKIALRLCDMRDHGTSGYRARLPAIRVNPRTGRSYVAVSEMQTAGLYGMPWEESRDTLSAVFDHLYAPEHVHEHAWHNGDLVIWDNLACQHARGWLRDVGLRVLQRVLVGPHTIAVRP